MIEYTKDAFDYYPSKTKDCEILDKFGSWNEFIFQCSDDSDAHLFPTECSRLDLESCSTCKLCSIAKGINFLLDI